MQPLDNSRGHAHLDGHFILLVEEQDKEVVASLALLDRGVQAHLKPQHGRDEMIIQNYEIGGIFCYRSSVGFTSKPAKALQFHVGRLWAACCRRPTSGPHGIAKLLLVGFLQT